MIRGFQLVGDGLERLIGEVEVKALEYLWMVKAYDKYPRTVREIHTKGNINTLCSRTKLKRELDELVTMGLIGKEIVAGRGGEKHRYWPRYDRKTTVQVLILERYKVLLEVAHQEGVKFIEYEK